MNKKIISILGHFALGQVFLDGQTVKTKTLYNALLNEKIFEDIQIIDTYNWRAHPLKLLFKVVKSLKNNLDIVILLSQNGMRVFFPIIYYLSGLLKCNVHHVVIGGNLDQLIEKHKNWIKYLNGFKANYVESYILKDKIMKLGVKNAVYLPNFKDVEILKENGIWNIKRPLKLCTFSRVMKEKGINDAIDAVVKINTELNQIIYTLDIYGQIDAEYKLEFEHIINNSPDYVQYKGIVEYNRSVEVLQKYFLLLFPTYFYGEGFPGTLIDAFASALPVVASDWHFNGEIIKDGETGRIVPPKNVEALARVLKELSLHTEVILDMKNNCIKEAKKYLTINAIVPLKNNLIGPKY